MTLGVWVLYAIYSNMTIDRAKIAPVYKSRLGYSAQILNVSSNIIHSLKS